MKLRLSRRFLIGSVFKHYMPRVCHSHFKSPWNLNIMGFLFLGIWWFQNFGQRMFAVFIILIRKLSGNLIIIICQSSRSCHLFHRKGMAATILVNRSPTNKAIDDGGVSFIHLLIFKLVRLALNIDI